MIAVLRSAGRATLSRPPDEEAILSGEPRLPLVLAKGHPARNGRRDSVARPSIRSSHLRTCRKAAEPLLILSRVSVGYSSGSTRMSVGWRSRSWRAVSRTASGVSAS